MQVHNFLNFFDPVAVFPGSTISNNTKRELYTNCLTCFEDVQNSLLLQHIFDHVDNDGSNSRVCTMCSKPFTKSKDLKEHIAGVHYKLQPYVCIYCARLNVEKSFGTFGGLKYHVKAQHKGKSKLLPCSYCANTFTDRTSLEQHKNLIHAAKITVQKTQTTTLKVPERNYNNNNLSTSNQPPKMQLRVKPTTPKPLSLSPSSSVVVVPVPCQECEQLLFPTNILQHIYSHLIPGQRKCNLCNFKSHKSHDLKEHLHFKHYKLSPYECKTCFKQYHTMCGFRYHFKSNVKCQIGNSSSVLQSIPMPSSTISSTMTTTKFNKKGSSSSLQHSRQKYGGGLKNTTFFPERINNNNNNNGTHHICQTCGIKLLPTELKEHLKFHIKFQQNNSTDGISKCFHCNFSTADSKYLLQHILRLHYSTFRPQKCPQCSRSFLSKSDLLSHIKFVHTKHRPFQCHVVQCSKQFVRLSDLKVHHLTHYKNQSNDNGNEGGRLMSSSSILSSSLKSKKKKHKSLKKKFTSELRVPVTIDNCQVYVRKNEENLIQNGNGNCRINLQHMMNTDYKPAHHHQLLKTKLHSPQQQQQGKETWTRPQCCLTCGTSFIINNASDEQLIEHLNSHLVFGQKQCHICTKYCTKSNDLKLHIYYNHYGIKPFKCNECNTKTFASKKGLIYHQNVARCSGSSGTSGGEPTTSLVNNSVNNLNSSVNTENHEMKPYEYGMIDFNHFLQVQM